MIHATVKAIKPHCPQGYRKKKGKYIKLIMHINQSVFYKMIENSHVFIKFKTFLYSFKKG